MKKVLSILLSVCLCLASTPFYLKAEEMTDVPFTIIKVEKETTDSDYTTIYFQTEIGLIYSTIEEKLIQIYDEDDHKLATGYIVDNNKPESFVVSKPNLIIGEPDMLNYSTYADYYNQSNMWSSWVTSNTTQVVITYDGNSVYQSVVNALIISAFVSKGNIYSMIGHYAIEAFTAAIMSLLWNGITLNLKVRYATNYSCSIIRKEQVWDNNLNVWGSIKGHWTDTPFNYSYPASCRYLEEIYSYN